MQIAISTIRMVAPAARVGGDGFGRPFARGESAR